MSTQPVDNVNMLISRRTLSPDVSRDSGGGGRTWDGKLALTLQERGVVLDELVRLLIYVSTIALALDWPPFSDRKVRAKRTGTSRTLTPGILTDLWVGGLSLGGVMGLSCEVVVSRGVKREIAKFACFEV